MCYVADYEYHHRQRAFKTDPCPAVLSLDGAHLLQSIKNFFRTTIHRKTYCTIYHPYDEKQGSNQDVVAAPVVIERLT
jgi:hypothetical protein